MQSPKGSEDFFHEKNCFSSKCSTELVESNFDNENIPQNSEVFPLKVQKKKIFKQTFFSSKCSPEGVKYIFENISIKLCRRLENVSFKVRKKVKTFFHEKNCFSSKCSYELVERNFENEKIPQNSEDFPLKVQKNEVFKKNIIFIKVFA